MTKEIRLCGRYSDLVTLVDDEQHPRLSTIPWGGNKKRNGVYAAWAVKRGDHTVHIYLARCVLQLPRESPLVVDHINGNTLDNRRENLRAISTARNLRNSSYRRSGVSVGASLDHDGRWRARINRGDRDYYLGRFDTEAEAAAIALRFEHEHEHDNDMSHDEFLTHVQEWRRQA